MHGSKSKSMFQVKGSWRRPVVVLFSVLGVALVVYLFASGTLKFNTSSDSTDEHSFGLEKKKSQGGRENEKSVAQKIQSEFRDGVFKPVTGPIGDENMTGTPKLIYKAPKGVQPGTLTVPEPHMARVKALYDSRYGYTTNPPTAVAKVNRARTAGEVNPVAGYAYRVNAVAPSQPASIGGPPRSNSGNSNNNKLFDTSDYEADWSQGRKGVVRAASSGPFAVPRHQQPFDNDPRAAYGETAYGETAYGETAYGETADNKERERAIAPVKIKARPKPKERAIAPVKIKARPKKRDENSLAVPSGAITGRQWEDNTKDWARVKQNAKMSLEKIADMFDRLFRDEVFPNARVENVSVPGFGEAVRVVDGASGKCIMLERYYEYVQASIATQMGGVPEKLLNWATGSSLKLGLDHIQESIPALREGLAVDCSESGGYEVSPQSNKIKSRSTDKVISYEVIWPRDQTVLFKHEMDSNKYF